MTIIDSIRGLRRLSVWEALRRSRPLSAALVVTLHLAAVAVMVRTETDWYGTALFLLTWGALNGFLLVVLRRPGIAAALSLAVVLVLVVLSTFKFWAIWTAIDFLDFLIVDQDTLAFVLMLFPDLRLAVLTGGMVLLLALLVLWRLEPLLIRRRVGATVGVSCLAGIVALSLAVPEEPHEPFQGINHVSNFSRSGVLSLSELIQHGWLETDGPGAAERLPPAATCEPRAKPPHIILVLDEASFDITAAPGIKVPAGYGAHFRSVDGKIRELVVEGSGGPTWYTEYNVLTGLAARSFGRLKFYVTRIAAGRVERGLPQALARCGYKTFSLYPAYGAFLSARKFQTGAGVDRFIDMQEMRSGFVEPDRFYYDQAVRLIERERAGGPNFIFVYTVANHFPWTERYLPELTPDWRDPGNGFEVDEYIRRQTMSARDYRDFIARLKRKFPEEAFLVVRFGDHQPTFSRQIVDPSLEDAEVARRLLTQDPRYYTTYYAIDAVNFTPADLTSALDRLEAPYLPLVVQEAAGLPLDPSFAEQKKILERCRGAFYRCAGGAEARRFNRLLIDAGLIRGMVSR